MRGSFRAGLLEQSPQNILSQADQQNLPCRADYSKANVSNETRIMQCPATDGQDKSPHYAPIQAVVLQLGAIGLSCERSRSVAVSIEFIYRGLC